MKYKTCKTCMRPILVNCEFDCEGKNVTVINVTAKQCPECGKTEIFSLSQIFLQWTPLLVNFHRKRFFID